MRTQWTTKGNRDAGSSCSCDRRLHRYLRNFGGGGVWTPQTPPLGTPLLLLPLWAFVACYMVNFAFTLPLFARDGASIRAYFYQFCLFVTVISDQPDFL